MIHLRRATIADCGKIYRMQVRAFQPLLDKYRDFLTNPAAEDVGDVIRRMSQPSTDYYFIQLEDEDIGAIRIVSLENGGRRISPIFLLPEFQGRGFAQRAIAQAEALYPQACGWQLDTIKEEPKLCHLYEKMGYRRTGGEESIQENMTIVYYAK